MPRPTYLADETSQLLDETTFSQQLEDGVSGLKFSAALPGAIGSLRQTAQAWKPLPIMVSDRPDARQIAQQQAQATGPTTSLAPTPSQGVGGDAASGMPAAMPSGGAGQGGGSGAGGASFSAGASTGDPSGGVDNSSRESFARSAYPMALRAAGGDPELAKRFLAMAISENGTVGNGGAIGVGNNFGGIKYDPQASGSGNYGTWESEGGQRVNQNANFAAYANPQDGFNAIPRFIQTNFPQAWKNYQQNHDAAGLIREINAGGYATNPTWHQDIEGIRAGSIDPAVGSPSYKLSDTQPADTGGLSAGDQKRQKMGLSGPEQMPGTISGPSDNATDPTSPASDYGSLIRTPGPLPTERQPDHVNDVNTEIRDRLNQQMYRQPLGPANQGPDTTSGTDQYDPRTADQGAHELAPNETLNNSQNNLTPANDPGGAQFAASDAYSTPQSGSVSSTSNEARNQEPPRYDPYGGTPDPTAAAVQSVSPDASPTAPTSTMLPVWDENDQIVGYRRAPAPEQRQNQQRQADGYGQVSSSPGEPDYVPSPPNRLQDAVAPAAGVYGRAMDSVNQQEDAVQQRAESHITSEIGRQITAPLEAITRGVRIATAIVQATPEATAETVNAALGAVGLGRDTYGVDTPLGRVGIGDAALALAPNEQIQAVMAAGMPIAHGRAGGTDILERGANAAVGTARDLFLSAGRGIRGALDANAGRVAAPGEMQLGSGVVPQGGASERPRYAYRDPSDPKQGLVRIGTQKIAAGEVDAQRAAIIANADHLGAVRDRASAETRALRHPDDQETQQALMDAVGHEERTKDTLDAAREYLQMVRTGDMQLGASAIPSISPGVRAAAYNAAQGGVVGAVGADQQAQQQGRESTPGERFVGAAGGAVLAMVAGNRGARNAVERLGSGFVGRGPTVEVLQQRLAQAQGIVDRVIQSGNAQRIAQAQENRAAIQSQLADAVNARRDLEPRIASDVGARESAVPPSAQTVENRMDAVMPPRDGRMRPQDLSGPVSIPVDDPRMRLGSGFVPADEPRPSGLGNVPPSQVNQQGLPGVDLPPTPMDPALRRPISDAPNAPLTVEQAIANRGSQQAGLPGLQDASQPTPIAQAAQQMQTTIPGPIQATALPPAGLNWYQRQAARNAAQMQARGIESLSPLRWVRNLASTVGYSSMIGPGTFSVSLASNALEPLYAAAKEPTRGVARAIQTRNLSALREPGEMAAGAVHGLGRVSGALWDVIRQKGAYASNPDMASLSERTASPAGKLLAQALEVPGRVWSGVPDAVFGTIAQGAGEARAAAQQATDAGLTGSAWKQHMSALLTDAAAVKSGQLPTLAGTQQVLDEANQYAGRMSYRDPLGTIGKTVRTATRMGDIPIVSNLIAPFFNTPWNIMLRQAERSPVGLVMNTQKGFDRHYDAIVGSALTLGLGGAAAAGYVTGSGPSDPGQRKLLEADGWKPYHTLVSLPGQQPMYVPNRMFGIAETLLNAAGDVHDFAAYRKPSDDARTLQTDALARIGSLVSQQPFAAGYTAIADLVQYGPESFAADQATRMTPFASSGRMIGTALDTKERRPDTGADVTPMQDFQGRYAAGVGNRSGLPATQDVLGHERPNQQRGPWALLPRFSPQTSSPVTDAYRGAQMSISLPPSDVSGVSLSPDQKRRYQELSGQLLEQIATDTVSDPSWKDIPLVAQKKILANFQDAAHKVAEAQIKGEMPDFGQRFGDAVTRKSQGLPVLPYRQQQTVAP